MIRYGESRNEPSDTDISGGNANVNNKITTGVAGHCETFGYVRARVKKASLLGANLFAYADTAF